eukprot:m.480607 g.480607  ORF g.480607 m.480607 type:complete len:1709 (+) comp21902_c0_seq1:465-5591(+)
MQFFLLLWKNYTLQKRRVFGTIIEIGLPVMFIALMVAIRSATNSSDSYKPDLLFSPFSPEPFVSNGALTNEQCDGKFYVAYGPTAAQDIMQNLQVPQVALTVKDFNDEEAMTNFLVQATDPDVSEFPPGCRVGIWFDTSDPNAYKYRLRFSSTPGGYDDNTDDFALQNWVTNLAFPVYQPPGPRGYDQEEDAMPFGGMPGYYDHNFLTFQHHVNKAIMAVESPGSTILDSLNVQRFPYPSFYDDQFNAAIKFGLPLLLMLAFMFTALNIVRNLVHEKERRLKESMKMMGLRNFIHWAAWFVQYFLFLMIGVVLMTILMSAGKLLKFSDMSIIFVYLMLYAVSTIALCFFISVFFSTASTAAAAAGLIWFMSYVPYFFIQQSYDTMSLQQKQLGCFISTTCMAMGGNVISIFEASGAGVTWSNFHEPVSADDSFSFAIVLGMLMFDTLYYLVLTWYIEAVWPGKYGIPKPWYFPFQASYWCGTSRRRTEEIPLLELNQVQQGDKFERDPAGLEPGIQIRNLRKEYGPKVAVEGTSLNFYRGQVTALLGHNGAGKTTTMHMLTGLFPPTTGTAIINGYDIRSETQQAQLSVGLCPQHDVLFDTLTVEEHLWFFCKLKKVPKDQIQQCVDDMIVDLQLEDKRHAKSATLSGGMKRKLCVGIALVGGSGIVILDEPTSGMDPSARRATWDLIVKHKRGRAVLLSTHFMDEADLLGDRIAIMSEGRVRCCGTSLFLKGKYGIGYHMTVVKSPQCDVAAVTALLAKHVPNVQLSGNVGLELTYILPRENSSSFEGMFRELEENQRALGIETYGASLTTMEEVFLSVGETVDGEKIDIETRIAGRKHEDRHVNADPDEETRVLLEDGGQQERNTGFALKVQQFYAMFVKRALYSRRNKWAIITQLFMPILYTILALVIAKTVPGPKDSPALSLMTLQDTYGPNTVLYTVDSGTTGQPNALTTSLGEALLQVLPATPKQELQEFQIGGTSGYNSSEYYLLDKAAGGGSRDVAVFNKRNLVALSFVPNGADADITAWFNGQAYHSTAEALALAANTVLYQAVSKTITVENAPLPRDQAELARSQKFDVLGFSISFNILFGMAFLSSSFALFLVTERATKAKHIQFVSGVNPISFWVSSFAWDFVNFLVPTAIIMIIFLAFGVDAYESDRLGMVFLLFISYGFAVIPVMYLLSFLFKVSSRAFTWLTLFNIVTGLAAMLTIMILGQIDPSTSQSLKTAFLFMPSYCFGQGLSDLYENYTNLKLIRRFITAQGLPPTRALINQACHTSFGPNDSLIVPCELDYLAWSSPGILSYVVCMIVQGVVFFCLVLFVDSQWFRTITTQLSSAAKSSQAAPDMSQEDDDVADERARVRRMMAGVPKFSADTQAPQDVVVVDNLTKSFQTGKCGGCCGGDIKRAVDYISVGVPQGECFGLLGVNGAGKTTTFRMLTGDEKIDVGGAVIKGYNIDTDLDKARQWIGYCPQHDGLIDLMTGREILTMFARMRGVPERHVPGVVTDLIQDLMLEKHADKPCGTYSGGNRRKLSTAVALVGDPAVVFLDEPTTGMDPGARRFLWDALQRVAAGGRSIVLTSHSMEECEALCSRLAIMVNGRFQCIGSPQHLKSRFGRGFIITAKLPVDAGPAVTDKLKEFLVERIPTCELKEERLTTVSYNVPIGQGVTWSSLFGTLEKAKQQFNLDDYSVAQTTLEQIFVGFARHQVEE